MPVAKQRLRTSIVIFPDERRPLNLDMRLLPYMPLQSFSRRSPPEMRSSVDRIVMEGGTHPFPIQPTIAPGQPLMFYMRSGGCRHRTPRTSFGSMEKTAQEVGSQFTRLADTFFSSLPASVSIQDGGMGETVLTGRLTAGRPTDIYCDTHRGCESIWCRPRSATCVDITALGEITKLLAACRTKRSNEFE